jgi:hypothetical protein
MWRPTCLVHLVWGLFIIPATTSCMALPGWAANAETQKLSFQLGLEPVPDLPEFLRPLEELCIRLLDKKGTSQFAWRRSVRRLSNRWSPATGSGSFD